jgi:hypothetical protein
MIRGAVYREAVALVLDGPVSGAELRREVNSALSAAGFPAWANMEAEVFTYGRARLVMARPVPPLSARGFRPGLRLRRNGK